MLEFMRTMLRSLDYDVQRMEDLAILALWTHCVQVGRTFPNGQGTLQEDPGVDDPVGRAVRVRSAPDNLLYAFAAGQQQQTFYRDALMHLAGGNTLDRPIVEQLTYAWMHRALNGFALNNIPAPIIDLDVAVPVSRIVNRPFVQWLRRAMAWIWQPGMAVRVALTVLFLLGALAFALDGISKLRTTHSAVVRIERELHNVCDRSK